MIIVNEREELLDHLERLLTVQSLPQLLLLEARDNQQEAVDVLHQVTAKMLRVLDLKSYPNFLLINNTASSNHKEILKKLHQLIHHTSDDTRVIILEDINCLNVNIINSCLKILERLPAQTHLMFTSSRLYNLPAILRSYCYLISWRSHLMTKNYEQLLSALQQNSAHQLQSQATSKEQNWSNFMATCLYYLERNIKYNIGILTEVLAIEKQMFSNQLPLLLIDKRQKILQMFSAVSELHLDKRQVMILIYELLTDRITPTK